ncbi:MAG: hypothetical protein IJ464_03250 [Alistipes sp.]|nr:hypothetical protein [Alistipes sp.]
MKKFFLWGAAALLAAFVVSLLVIHRLANDNERLRHNQHALLQSVTIYRTKAGESAARVEALELSVAEFKEYRARDAAKIRSLGVRLRRAESSMTSATKSYYEATTTLRDTIILRDTVRDTIRIFEDSDKWSSISGRVHGDSVSYTLHTVDTLHQVIHRVPRKFLFIKYGTKAIRQEIWSSNPHTELVYTEYIELKNNRRR